MLERKTQKVTVPTIATKQVKVPTAAGLKSKLAGKAASAQSSADSRASRLQRKAAKAQSRAGSRLSDAKAAAVPALAAAGAAVAPKIDGARERVETDVLPRVAETRDQLVEAKDSFVEETLPKIVEAVTGAVAASPLAASDAVAKVRDSDTAQRAVASLKGEKAPKKKSGGVVSGLLTTVGILGAAVGLAWFFNKKNAEQDDPWARPLADPYVPPTSGADASPATPATTPAMASPDAPADAAPVVDGPATFTPAVGQVSDVPSENNELIPPADNAVGDQEIRVIDPLDDHRTGPQNPGERNL